MARARNIKPGFFRNAQLVELAFDRRLLFAGLWTLSDREGRLEDRPKQIKMEIFPADNVDVDKALNDLAGAELILRYAVGGKRYIQIVNFLKHQHPHYLEAPSTIPKPEIQVPMIDTKTLDYGAVNEDVNLSRDLDKPRANPSDSLLLIPDSLNPSNPLSGKPDDDPPKKLNGSAFYPDAQDVLAYLNKSTGKGFEFRTRAGELTASADMIVQRLKQGYTREELREVVHAKCGQWLHDEDMNEYLRPETLFAKRKFEQYLGELKGANG